MDYPSNVNGYSLMMPTYWRASIDYLLVSSYKKAVACLVPKWLVHKALMDSKKSVPHHTLVPLDN